MELVSWNNRRKTRKRRAGDETSLVTTKGTHRLVCPVYGPTTVRRWRRRVVCGKPLERLGGRQPGRSGVRRACLPTRRSAGPWVVGSRDTLEAGGPAYHARRRRRRRVTCPTGVSTRVPLCALLVNEARNTSSGRSSVCPPSPFAS